LGDGKCKRASQDYGKWAADATSTGAQFIDLNAIIADQYDQLGGQGERILSRRSYPYERAGARLNAKSV